jgi:hypothetical protein
MKPIGHLASSCHICCGSVFLKLMPARTVDPARTALSLTSGSRLSHRSASGLAVSQAGPLAGIRPLVVEEAESGGDVSYAELMGCLLDFGGAAVAAGFDDGGHAARGGVVDVVAEREVAVGGHGETGQSGRPARAVAPRSRLGRPSTGSATRAWMINPGCRCGLLGRLDYPLRCVLAVHACLLQML